MELPPEPPSEPDVSPVPTGPSISSDLDDATVADVATNMWRVMRRFADAEDGAHNGEIPKAQRMTVRNMRAMSQRLAEAGVKVQDHDGIDFDPGLRLKVLAYEPRPGIDREFVVETVLPSVYRTDRCIQIGEVIVGFPEKGQDNGS